jgi:hypothetical protein
MSPVPNQTPERTQRASDASSWKNKLKEPMKGHHLGLLMVAALSAGTLLGQRSSVQASAPGDDVSVYCRGSEDPEQSWEYQLNRSGLERNGRRVNLSPEDARILRDELVGWGPAVSDARRSGPAHPRTIEGVAADCLILRHPEERRDFSGQVMRRSPSEQWWRALSER